MNIRLQITFFITLLSAFPMALADSSIGSKSITIDDSSYSKIYPAVWFNPDTGTVHQIMKMEEKAPDLGTVIWIEPNDLEFRVGPGIKTCTLAVVGYGEEEFTKEPAAGGTKIDKIEKKVLSSNRKPVVLIESTNSRSLIIIDGLDEKTKSFKFRWRLVKSEQHGGGKPATRPESK